MFVSKEKILEKLFSLERKGINPGLDRISYLLEKTGNPHDKFPSIHVAGTNGKGSTASLIASILTEAGYRTGLYTSPHIKQFNERIRICGKTIPDDDLIQLAIKYMEIGNSVGATFFEITTAIAFDYFARNNIEIAVVETGLGGRLDATNVLSPLLSIITSIAIEHTDYLGNTIEQIAFEKGGIIKQNTPTIIGLLPTNAFSVIEQICLERKSRLIQSNSAIANIIGINPDFSMQYQIKTNSNHYIINSPLVGNHQAINHSLAVLAAESVSQHFSVSQQSIYDGVKNVVQNTGLCGRFQIISHSPKIILDTAHNPAAFEKLAETTQLLFPETKFNLVFGAMSDKNVSEILDKIKLITNLLIIAQPSTRRAMPANSIKQIADKLQIESIIIENPQQAYEYAKSKNEPVIVAGSFYLLADINY